jgi:ABC-type branched-subunit amino acid transport system ATPase component
MSGTVLIMTLFGGTATLLGPFLGAGVFIWMRDFVSKHLEYWEVFVGAAFVLIVLFCPDGIVGAVTRFLARRKARPVVEPEDHVPEAVALVPTAPAVPDGGPALLESRGLTKAFGGLTAVNHVDFQVRKGELRSVIGPNGAGKTTFFNLLTGVLPPSGGHILFKGGDITGLPAHAVSRLGISRSYQVTNIFGDLTVFENVRIAAQSRVTHYRFWGNADRLTAVNARAEEILREMGLWAKRDVRGAELSHGEQRYLEIGVALATEPDFLLLDEPTAGMSPDETRRTAAFVRKLAGQVTIVVVEHDMEVVMGISDRITVLNYGEVLAEGTPAEIRDNADVRRVYLRD